MYLQNGSVSEKSHEAHTPRMIRDGVPVANSRTSTHGIMVEVLVDGNLAIMEHQT